MSFYTEVICKHRLFLTKQRVALLELLEPVTRQAVQAVVADAIIMSLPLMVLETYRSLERQKQLFEDGKTELRTVGVHHYGLAADLVRLVDGKPDWSVDYGFLAALARKHGLVSGLDWGTPGVHHNFVDAGHVQRVAVDHQAQLFNASWYPDELYSPYTLEA